jgi:hypothetical protein
MSGIGAPLQQSSPDPTDEIKREIGDAMKVFLDSVIQKYELYIGYVGSKYKYISLSDDLEERVKTVHTLYIYWAYIKFLINNNQKFTDNGDKIAFVTKYDTNNILSVDQKTAYDAKCQVWYDAINWDQIKTLFDNIFKDHFNKSP